MTAKKGDSANQTDTKKHKGYRSETNYYGEWPPYLRPVMCGILGKAGGFIHQTFEWTQG